MITLVYRHDYKLIWDGDLVHIFYVDGALLRLVTIMGGW